MKDKIYPGPWEVEKITGKKYYAKNASDESTFGPFQTKQEAVEYCNEENGELADSAGYYKREIKRSEDNWEP